MCVCARVCVRARACTCACFQLRAPRNTHTACTLPCPPSDLPDFDLYDCTALDTWVGGDEGCAHFGLKGVTTVVNMLILVKTVLVNAMLLWAIVHFCISNCQGACAPPRSQDSSRSASSPHLSPAHGVKSAAVDVVEVQLPYPVAECNRME